MIQPSNLWSLVIPPLHKLFYAFLREKSLGLGAIECYKTRFFKKHLNLEPTNGLSIIQISKFMNIEKNIKNVIKNI